MARIMLIYFKILIIINSCVFMNIYVPSESMENTVPDNSYLFCQKINENYKAKRYDVLVFICPVNNDELYIKRVIGLPGEHIDIEDGKVYVNEKEIEEDYLKENWTVDNDNYSFDVPDDNYFVLGDNRNNSYDSRYWIDNVSNEYIYLNREKFVAKPIFVFYPTFKLI